MTDPSKKKKSFRLVLHENLPVFREVQWHTRGYLPHYEDWTKIQSVTFRLADALPQQVVEQLAHLHPEKNKDTEYRKKIESYLDAGYGECLLRKPEVTLCLTENLIYFNTQRYVLHAWVIMPNHVHVLFEAIKPYFLSNILKNWKSYTSHRINKILSREGQVWHEEYWDRYIRNEEHYQNCVSYIRENPVKAGLVKNAEEWPWSGFIEIEKSKNHDDKSLP